MTKKQTSFQSAATEALIAAGDSEQAEDIAVIEAATEAAQKKLRLSQCSVVERMIYGPQPDIAELCGGAERMLQSGHESSEKILKAAMANLASGQAFTTDNKISSQLRDAVAKQGGYGFTVPAEYQGLGLHYSQLARLEEDLAARGLGSLAVELSGQLTIGSSALLAYGSNKQKSTFLPQISNGTLIAFALTEVGVGVNAKKVRAWVEKDEAAACWRLHAKGASSKLYITSAMHSGLAAIVARKGKESRDLGLFIVELPKEDVETEEYGFSCMPSNTHGFAQNINSRLSFRNFPIPLDQQIEANGVEVLFYCLRMGRCMLASMSAGFQRMLAADAVNYAKKREGVGGHVIKHEIPRLNIAKILGGALTSQALSHLSLAQDAEGADLKGLRDLTKSASASYLLQSLTACERVIGGRSLDKGSRISEARPTVHAFGIVEGEDSLIRLGMVKELSAGFTDKYLKGLLAVLQRANLDKQGQALPADQRIYKLGLKSFLKYPKRSFGAVAQLLISRDFWALLSWAVSNTVKDLGLELGRMIPTSWLSRYCNLPLPLARHVRTAERGLRHCRWQIILLNMAYQLELTWAQLPMLRLGKKIELLTSLLVVCCHASKLDKSAQRVALLQAELIKNELNGESLLGFNRLRDTLNAVAEDLQNGSSSLISDLEPQQFAHHWEDD